MEKLFAPKGGSPQELLVSLTSDFLRKDFRWEGERSLFHLSAKPQRTRRGTGFLKITKVRKNMR